ncbi:MAG: ABC transporter permease [Gemmatimonadaceae bacterium]
MNGLLNDFRFGWRSLVKQPSFAAIAIATMAIGIGATTAIFSVVDGVLLRPLPYTQAERLVKLQTTKFNSASAKDYRDWRAQSKAFETVAATLDVTSYNVSGGDTPDRVSGMAVSASLFPMLGIAPQTGRYFTEAEDQKGVGKVVLLSDQLWQRRFGSAQNVVGQFMILDSERYEIIGVMPRGFGFASNDAELWLPIAADFEDMGRGNYFFHVYGKIKTDVTLPQAQADISAIARQLERQYPETNTGAGVRLVPLLESIAGNMRPTLLVLFGTAGFLLLIACTNVANLMLVRATMRRKEIAVRVAHGASTWRIVQQLLAESALLSFIGSICGLGLAFAFCKILIALAPHDIPRLSEIVVNQRVLAFAIVLGACTGILFGLIPALQSARPNVNGMLKEQSRGATSSRSAVQDAFVVAEIALALLLSVGAGLMTRSFIRLLHVDPGFSVVNTLSFSVSLPYTKYSQAQMPGAYNAATSNFYSEALDGIAKIPGVVGVGATTALPLSEINNWRYVYVEGAPFGTPQMFTGANYRGVSTDYFRTIGMRVLQGRGVLATDRHDAEPVVVINSAFAAKFFPGVNALDKRIKMGTIPDAPASWMRVVGIVNDVRHTGPDARPVPEVYRPYQQSIERFMTFAVRTAGAPEAIVPAVRRTILAIDNDLPIASVKTMDQLLSQAVAGPRFVLSILTTFSMIALLLATIGLYGVMSFVVAQRNREMAIRTALGAQRRDVLKLVMRLGARLTAAGLATGLVVSLMLSQVMNKLLFATNSRDPLTIATILLILALAGLAACFIPALRAARVNSLVAMQEE